MVTIIALSFLKLCTILATVATASASSDASVPLPPPTLLRLCLRRYHTTLTLSARAQALIFGAALKAALQEINNNKS